MEIFTLSLQELQPLASGSGVTAAIPLSIAACCQIRTWHPVGWKRQPHISRLLFDECRSDADEAETCRSLVVHGGPRRPRFCAIQLRFYRLPRRSSPGCYSTLFCKPVRWCRCFSARSCSLHGLAASARLCSRARSPFLLSPTISRPRSIHSAWSLRTYCALSCLRSQPSLWFR